VSCSNQTPFHFEIERRYLKPSTVLNRFFDYLQLIVHFVEDQKHPLCLIEPLSSLFVNPIRTMYPRSLFSNHPQLVSWKGAPIAPPSAEPRVMASVWRDSYRLKLLLLGITSCSTSILQARICFSTSISFFLLMLVCCFYVHGLGFQHS